MTPDKNKNLLNLIEKIAHEASESYLDFRDKIADADAVNEIAGFLSVMRIRLSGTGEIYLKVLGQGGDDDQVFALGRLQVEK